MIGVYAFSEKQDIVFELLAKGRLLADQIGGTLVSIAVGDDAASKARELVAFGADRVFMVKDADLNSFHVETYTDLLSQLMGSQVSEVLLIGGTKNGTQLAASVAQRLGVGSASDCIELKVEEGRLVIDRVYYGGKFVARQVLKRKPWVVTVPPRRFEARARDDTRKGEVVELNVQVKAPRVRVVDVKVKEKGAVQIEKAEVIVAIGRGVKKREDVAMMQELAQTVDGALAGSRPITEDLKWLPGDVQVGLSGRKVKPKLYVACGISGQIQHIVGMRESKTVVAINIDGDAPIMEEADYCVVGDLYKYVPALTQAFKEALARS